MLTLKHAIANLLSEHEPGSQEFVDEMLLLLMRRISVIERQLDEKTKESSTPVEETSVDVHELNKTIVDSIFGRLTKQDKETIFSYSKRVLTYFNVTRKK